MQKTVAWSYDMEGHAKKCVERYCELVREETCLMFAVTIRRMMSTLQWTRSDTNVRSRTTCCLSVTLLRMSVAPKCCSNQISWCHSTRCLVCCMRNDARCVPRNLTRHRVERILVVKQKSVAYHPCIESVTSLCCNLETEAVQARQRQSSAEHALAVAPSTYPAVILRGRCNKYVSWSHRHAYSWQNEIVHGSDSRMDNMAIHVQGIRVRSASEDEGSLRSCDTERLRCCGQR